MRLLVLTLAACALAAALVSRLDLPRESGGIKGDEATYVAMAASLALDGDLEYTQDDYTRIRQWYGSGPEGIFLKRDASGDLHFGKAYVYGVLAAPFAWAGLRGLLFFNTVCLIVTIAAGFWWLAPGSRPRAALAYSSLFVFAAITPLYAVWLTSETLNYTLVFLAFAFGWPSSRGSEAGQWQRWTGVLLLAAAIFSKPLNAPLVVPFAMGTSPDARRQAMLVVATGLAVVALFAINAVFMDDFNYQGGDRKTFYTRFPYDEPGGSFDTTGIQMTTNTLQTPVGREGRLTTAPLNAWYFFTGRHFGMLLFGWPWVLSGLLWLLKRRDKRAAEWALCGALVVTAAATVIWMPYTWSGGGGPVGNRYFLSLGAAMFFLTPRLQSMTAPVVAAIGLLFVTPAELAPFETARNPWRATQALQFRAFPLELTGASDFPIILDQRRGRVPQGSSPTVFVAFIDDAADFGERGWIAVHGGERTELLVRSPERLQSVTLGVKTPGVCAVGLRDGTENREVPLAAGDRRDLALTPAQVFSRDSFVFVLTVDATRCEAPIEVALQGHPKALPASGGAR